MYCAVILVWRSHLPRPVCRAPAGNVYLAKFVHRYGGSKDEVQRFLFWTAVTFGACGHTYGAQGIWAMSSRKEPFCGTTGSWGDGFWQDVMHYPGSSHLGLGAQFLRRYPWWLFEPRLEPETEKLNRVSSFACGIPGKLAFFYLPSCCVAEELQGINNTWNGGLAPIRIEPGATYRANQHGWETSQSMDN